MKNDFCVEEMMTTSFPPGIRLSRISDLYFDYYWTKEVDEWIQKAIADFPDMVDIMERNRTGSHRFNTRLQYKVEAEAWFTKWLSQFIEYSELASDTE